MKCSNILQSPIRTIAFSGSVSGVFGPSIERCPLILQAKPDIFFFRTLQWNKDFFLNIQVKVMLRGRASVFTKSAFHLRLEGLYQGFILCFSQSECYILL